MNRESGLQEGNFRVQNNIYWNSPKINKGNKNLVSFTGTPVTLQMLIGDYHTGYGVLPNSRIDIYKQGCRGLVSEVNICRKTKQ
ncbi:hypothetical protein ABE55_19885 [Bacillus thuringiensis]|nr:hypothetical protein [Bacillus thuringiensis]PES30321.1 hypothetical protein CN496_09440 [Bacillus cereus]PET85001.1 hypothetical protein CN528_06735 [Bacillus cereus]